jgi:hypothetical protein
VCGYEAVRNKGDGGVLRSRTKGSITISVDNRSIDGSFIFFIILMYMGIEYMIGKW